MYFPVCIFVSLSLMPMNQNVSDGKWTRKKLILSEWSRITFNWSNWNSLWKEENLETTSNFIFFIHYTILSCSVSNDDLTRILLINWISITIYGCAAKAARNRVKLMHAGILCTMNPLIRFTRVQAVCLGYRFFFVLHNVIIYEESSVKNCICHKSSEHPRSAEEFRTVWK